MGDQQELTGLPRTPGVELAAEAIEALRARRTQLGLSSTLDDFAILSSHRGLDGLDHVRLQQLHRGVPVWGADVVIHASADAFRGVSGNLASIADLDAIAGVASELAIDAAKADRVRAARAGDRPWFDRAHDELVIFPVTGQPARLTWHISLFTDNDRGSQPAWWNYFIDAHDGAIVYSFDGLPTLLANGPGGNARVSRQWSTLDVTQSGSLYLMTTPPLETHDDQNNNGTGGCDVVHICARKGDAAFEINDAGVFQSSTLTFPDRAGNDAHGFAGITLSMLQNLFGLNSINNAGFQITNHVHYSNGFSNAIWNPELDQVYFGDGDGVQSYAWSGAIEVVAHEIHHGFTQFHSALHFDTTASGGLNESFSDIAGATARFYGDIAPTFDFGANIMVQPNVALRYMCDPTRDGVSIDNAANFVVGMDQHYSSGVMNKAFCRAAKRISGADPDTGQATLSGVSRAARAWYTANMSYWTSATQFVDACQGVVDAAEALGLSASDVAAIGRSWQDVGVNCRFPIAWFAGNMDVGQLTDLIEVFDNGAGHAGLRVYRSTGTGYTASFSSSDLGQSSSALAWLTGAVNVGDQLTDVIQLSDHAGQLRITVYRSTGAGYTLDSVTDTGRSPAALAWLTGDVDHDGRTDIIQPFDNAGRLGIAVYSPDATGYRVNTVTPDLGQGSGALAWLTGDCVRQLEHGALIVRHEVADRRRHAQRADLDRAGRE
jgi:Zn-dependent metalloprotease